LTKVEFNVSAPKPDAAALLVAPAAAMPQHDIESLDPAAVRLSSEPPSLLFARNFSALRGLFQQLARAN